MRVLQVLPRLESGGVERGAVEMAAAIAAAGGEAVVASAGGRMVRELVRAGGRHVGLALATKDPLSIWLNGGRLAGLVRRERLQIVHARSRAPAWSALRASRLTGARFVTTWHGLYSETLPLKRRYNAVMAAGERVIAISRFVAGEIERRHGIDPARVRVIPRGVDPARFDPDRVRGDRIARLAQAWNLPDGARIVMLPGRLTRWKGQEVLLDALAGLDDPSVLAVLVGGGKPAFARALLRRAERLGIAGRLRFAGDCDDMPAALALAEVVVSASTAPEAFGRVVIEAQAMARPVIATGHGGAAETVTDGETGWHVPPGDAAALAARLSAVLALPAEERAWAGARARAAVAARYTTAAMQAATLDVYREVLERP